MRLIPKIRKSLYNSAKALGDIDAIKEGKIAKRVKNRIAGKLTGKMLKKI